MHELDRRLRLEQALPNRLARVDVDDVRAVRADGGAGDVERPRDLEHAPAAACADEHDVDRPQRGPGARRDRPVAAKLRPVEIDCRVEWPRPDVQQRPGGVSPPVASTTNAPIATAIGAPCVLPTNAEPLAGFTTEPPDATTSRKMPARPSTTRAAPSSARQWPRRARRRRCRRRAAPPSGRTSRP